MDKSILIPTDFSDVAYHAAEYAIELGRQFNIKRLVLYHAWQQPIVVDPNMVNTDMVNTEELMEIGDESLHGFTKKVKQLAGGEFEVVQEMDYSPVAGGVADMSVKHHAAYVIMSVTGSGKFVEKVLGSNAVSTAKAIHVPVIIVPGAYHFQKIEHVALTCDYKNIETTIPFEPIKQVLDDSAAKLLVVYVDTTRETLPDSLEEQNRQINTFLERTDAQFHVVEDDSFIHGITEFAEENHIELIVAVPRKKGFLEVLFKGSRTTELAFNSKIPILVVHKELE
ncbi:MAG: universal stress protein [Chitinophagaceae bacterium]